MSPSPRTLGEMQGGTGVPLPARPVIYEINTRLWLRELSHQYGRPVTLADVPAAAWDQLADFRFDAVWLMGVWERSAFGPQVDLEDPERRQQFDAILPDWTSEDVIGSPYAVRCYSADPALGGRAGLATARAELAQRGMSLILDFTPNHVARDHDWVTTRPELFISGTADDLAAAPDAFFVAGKSVVAHGRDPNFRPWRDSAQLNVFDSRLRAAAIETLRDIAGQCDGIRFTSAMLVINEVFAGNWGRAPASGPTASTGGRCWPPSAPRTPPSASSPRSIGAASGSCCNRASTCATTSNSTTAWCMRRPSGCAAT